MAKVTINLAALEGIADRKAEAGLKKAMLQGEARLKVILSQPGSGRKYGKHTASAPGESPAPDTGGLRQATQADTVVRQDGADKVGRIVSNKEYALPLEKGSKHSASSRTADGLFGMRGKYGPARMTALESEVGTERTAARPFLSLLATDHADELRDAFIAGAKE